jgi:hypothetical protein
VLSSSVVGTVVTGSVVGGVVLKEVAVVGGGEVRGRVVAVVVGEVVVAVV